MSGTSVPFDSTPGRPECLYAIFTPAAKEEKVMAFAHIIEFRTDKLDQIRSGGEDYEKDLAGKHKVRRRVVAEDQDHPGRYFLMAFCDSYEDAMQNSAPPETDALSKKMAALVDGPPSFFNLNILEERQF
jgi:hypothetical protein